MIVYGALTEMSHPQQPHVLILSYFIWCPAVPRCFFPQWLICMFFFKPPLSANQALLESSVHRSWSPEQFKVSHQPKVPGVGLWEMGMQKTPLTTPLTSTLVTLDEVTLQCGQRKLSVMSPYCPYCCMLIVSYFFLPQFLASFCRSFYIYYIFKQLAQDLFCFFLSC